MYSIWVIESFRRHAKNFNRSPSVSPSNIILRSHHPHQPPLHSSISPSVPHPVVLSQVGDLVPHGPRHRRIGREGQTIWGTLEQRLRVCSGVRRKGGCVFSRGAQTSSPSDLHIHPRRDGRCMKVYDDLFVQYYSYYWWCGQPV